MDSQLHYKHPHFVTVSACVSEAWTVIECDTRCNSWREVWNRLQLVGVCYGLSFGEHAAQYSVCNLRSICPVRDVPVNLSVNSIKKGSLNENRLQEIRTRSSRPALGMENQHRICLVTAIH